MTMTTIPTKETGFDHLLSFVAAFAAIAGGLIHFNVIGDHAEFEVVAAGFGLMGFMQWAFAWRILTRPSRGILGLGGLLHAGIATLWIASRTIGLPFVDGARLPAAVGVADLAANVLSVVVVGAAFLGLTIHLRDYPVDIPSSVVSRMKIAAVGLVIFVTVPGLFAPHTHSHETVESHPAEATHDHASSFGPES